MFRHLFISLIFGALVGASTALYSFGLERVQIFHQTETMYPLALILVFGLIYLVKRHTLYFPTQVSQVVDSSELEQRHWSPFSYLWNIVGSWLSHLAGASLGREGTVLVLASSLAQLCRLNWNYYKPIVISAAFACVVGQPFIAVIFIIEMFATSIDQKVFAVIMAWIGFLVMQSLGVHPLFSTIAVDLSAGFFDKLFTAILIGLSAGVLTNMFKLGYLYLSDAFKKYKLPAILTVLVLSWFFLQPETRFLHSLSLNTFAEIQTGKADIQFVFLKSILTMLFISLGFIGGDFVPAIAIGSAIGVLISTSMSVPFTFGLAMGLMAFFTGLTRLKWTAVWLIFFLCGFKVMLWAYVCLSVTRQFSGMNSLYKKS